MTKNSAPMFCQGGNNLIERDCPACVDKVIKWANIYHLEQRELQRELVRITLQRDGLHEQIEFLSGELFKMLPKGFPGRVSSATVTAVNFIRALQLVRHEAENLLQFMKQNDPEAEVEGAIGVEEALQKLTQEGVVDELDRI